MNAIAKEQQRSVKLAKSSRLISAAKVRRYLLDVAAASVENAVRNFCRRLVAAAPSKGVTL